VRGAATTTTSVQSMIYTADGDRILRKHGTTVTAYIGGGQEITLTAGNTNASSVTATRYYTFAGQTVAVRTGMGMGGVTSLVNDPHGTPLASVHNTQWTTTSVNKHHTLPYGQARGGTPPPGDHRFLGAPEDPTGLTLLGARYYDPATGRFLSVDPIMNLADPQQWNGYAYANNSPITYSDPTGLVLAPPTPTIDGNLRQTDWTNRLFANKYNRDANLNPVKALPRLAPKLAARVGVGLIFGVVIGVVANMVWDVANAPSVGDATCPIGGCPYLQDKIIVTDLAHMNRETGTVSVTRPPAPQPAAGGASNIGIGGGDGGTRTTFADPADDDEPEFDPSDITAKTADDWAPISGILRGAAAGKGNFGLGTGTAAQAQTAGQSWVGRGARLASDGKTWLSQDGLRQWRPPSFKPKLGKWQSNFESRWEPMGRWQTNGHLDISDLS
jgi:RHS repeat-associated protein